MTPRTPFIDLVTRWVVSQRWYGGKAGSPNLERIGGWTMEGPAGVRLRTHLLMEFGTTPPTLYQVPITERTAPLEGADAAHLGELVDDDGMRVHLYDAPHDPAYAEALLRLMAGGGHAAGDRASAVGVSFLQHPDDAMVIVGTRVLGRDQSNTSIVYEVSGFEGTTQVICKVYRALHHGDNPDVVLQSALTAAGSPYVPASVGAIEAEWPDTGREEGTARGHAAFAQQFLSDAEDAWSCALRDARAGNDFSARAHTLGRATAEVHAVLASALPIQEATPSDVEEVVQGWHRRLDAAVREVPSLAKFEAPITALYSAARGASWPALQRIHGDYHLGQVLALPDGGWVLLDFEGEPMRPMVERARLDFAVRDVAGMLRSFDYVAGSLARTADSLADGSADPMSRSQPALDPEAWAASARHAFLDGYIAESGVDLRADRTLLDAFKIDKALYEAVYEARNRPDWLPIPTAALARLVDPERDPLD